MEQTTSTVWEAIKMLRQIPFEDLKSNFARSLVLVIAKVPFSEIAEVQRIQTC